MTDGEIPPQTFPNYQPIPPVQKEGPDVAHPKQAKPLMKLINRMLKPRPKTRVSHVKKRLVKKKHEEVGWI